MLNKYSSGIGAQVYPGYWLDLTATSALAALGPITRLSAGTVVVRLHRSDIYFENGKDTPWAIHDPQYTDNSSMEVLAAYDDIDAERFGASAKNMAIGQFVKLGR